MVFWGVLGCFGVFWGVFGCLDAPRGEDVAGVSLLYLLLEVTNEPVDTPRHPQTPQNMHRCIVHRFYVFSDVFGGVGEWVACVVW